jgi:hypothetical protein
VPLTNAKWKAQGPPDGHGKCVTNVSYSGHDDSLRKVTGKCGLEMPKMAGAGRGGCAREIRMDKKYVLCTIIIHGIGQLIPIGCPAIHNSLLRIQV